MGIDVSVRFEELRREANGNVKGKVLLKLSGDIAGHSFDQQIDGRNFDFPKDGEQAIYDQEFDVAVLKAKVTAKVYEKPSGQCCIQGNVELKGPLGIGGSKELDPNCHPIP